MSATAIVVDDSKVIRSVLKLALTQAGFEVVAEAATGAEVLALYEKHRPTVLTLDIILPEMDGVTAVRELLKKHPEANVVMCSSVAAKDKMEACRKIGVTRFILKPFTPESVAETVRSLVPSDPGVPS